MSRFHFHVHNGSLRPDPSGEEFEHADRARLEAASRLGRLIDERPENLWLDGSLSLTVTDERGLMLFVLDLPVTTSPAAPACRLQRR